jgi:hypothetical protein
MMRQVRLHIGSIDGSMRIAASLCPKRTEADTRMNDISAKKSKKRSRTSEEEDKADAIIADLVRNSESGHVAHTKALELCREAVKRLVQIRGSAGEKAVEAVGICFQSKKEITVEATKTQKPQLMLSVRFAPGSAIPVSHLLTALDGVGGGGDGVDGEALDGALTTTTQGLDRTFQLPRPPNDIAVDQCGQSPLFMYLAVDAGPQL